MDYMYTQDGTSKPFTASIDDKMSNARKQEFLRRYFYYSRQYNYINHRLLAHVELDPMMIQLVNYFYKDEILSSEFNVADLADSTQSFIEFNDIELNHL